MSGVRGTGLEGDLVGRKALLDWLNGFLQLNYTKIEQLASGAAYCQLFDALHPGKVALHKVNFDAKFEYEYVKNYKVLQEAFQNVGLTKVIDVNNLVKATFMDNIQFFRWMKQYFDENYSYSLEYNAEERRQKAVQVYLASKSSTSGAPPRKVSAGAVLTTTTVTATTTKKENKPPSTNTPRTSIGSEEKAKPTTTPSSSSAPASKTHTPISSSSSLSARPQRKPLSPTNGQIQKLTGEVTTLQILVESLEKERDFYFAKLRDVEIQCQEWAQGTEEEKKAVSLEEFIKKVQTTLYAED